MTIQQLLQTINGDVKITISRRIIDGETTTISNLITLYSGGDEQLNSIILSETVTGIDILGKTRIQVWLTDIVTETNPGENV